MTPEEQERRQAIVAAEATGASMKDRGPYTVPQYDKNDLDDMFKVVVAAAFEGLSGAALVHAASDAIFRIQTRPKQAPVMSTISAVTLGQTSKELLASVKSLLAAIEATDDPHDLLRARFAVGIMENMHVYADRIYGNRKEPNGHQGRPCK